MSNELQKYTTVVFPGSPVRSPASVSSALQSYHSPWRAENTCDGTLLSCWSNAAVEMLYEVATSWYLQKQKGFSLLQARDFWLKFLSTQSSAKCIHITIEETDGMASRPGNAASVNSSCVGGSVQPIRAASHRQPDGRLPGGRLPVPPPGALSPMPMLVLIGLRCSGRMAGGSASRRSCRISTR